MKKFFMSAAIACVAAIPAFAFEWDETGYLYPEEEPDDIWTEWEHYAIADHEWSGINAGFWSYDTEIKKRVSKDPENHKYQFAFVQYFAPGTDLVVEYDPDLQKFRIPIQQKGVRNIWDNEPFLCTDYETFYGQPDPYSSFDEVNGIINLWVVDYYPNQDNGDGTYSDKLYYCGTEKFYMKGFTKYDVAFDAPECVNSTELATTLTLTVHPKNVCYELINDYVQLRDTTVFEGVAERKLNPIEGTTEVNLTLKPGVNSLVCTSYDDKNKLVHSVCNIYCMPDEMDKWKSIGTGKFSEDAVLGLGGAWDVKEIDVEIQENIEKPGYYRLVNPYKDFPTHWTDLAYTHGEHNHYLYLDASKPKQVMLVQQPTGIYVDDNLQDAYLTSMAYEMKRAGKLQPEYTPYLGKLEDGKITFPEGSIGIRLPEYTKVLSEDLIYWVNNNGLFTVTLPVSGVEAVGVDAGDTEAAEYFTIQGVRVSEPADGELVIVRRAGKASKEMFRK